ncbi:MAG: hypothetical protein QOI80_469 [Solirubrobacteraceae bacterium]|nr:hypothetical protein [Solirubrobacteraceae bacterium]
MRSWPSATTSHSAPDFARAVADKDAARVRELLQREVDFRGLTPSRHWEATGADAVIATLFDSWFEAADRIDALEAVETDAFADRERVGRIGWMRVVCSGFRPA